MSKNCIQTLTTKKQPRSTLAAQTRTAEKVLKPLTIAEMRAEIQGILSILLLVDQWTCGTIYLLNNNSFVALKIQSPKRFAQATSAKKKNWNSSVKVDKTISHTANGQLKNNPVRKVLNFQPKNKVHKICLLSIYWVCNLFIRVLHKLSLLFIKVVVNARATMIPRNPVTPKFPKPEFRAKKSLHQQGNFSDIS